MRILRCRDCERILPMQPTDGSSYRCPLCETALSSSEEGAA